MIRAAVLLLLAATVSAAEVPVAQIADDAKAIDRVAAASKRDLPRDLLRRMIDEDIELLRGKRNDGTYDFASHDRLEAGRTTESFSVEKTDPDKPMLLEVRAPFAYKLVIEIPSRRMLVTKNRKLYVERVDIEYIPERGGASKVQSVPIRTWLEPGTTRSVDIDDIARQATARVYAYADKEAGYSNVALSLLKARITDNPDSPYADAVASAKAIQRGLDNSDIPSIRAMAQRMANALAPQVAAQPVSSIGATPSKTIEVVAPRQDPETLNELQTIEDLLTGNDAERRQGLDRLHQLIRKLRTTPR
jgi:hypothetical protein